MQYFTEELDKHGTFQAGDVRVSETIVKDQTKTVAVGLNDNCFMADISRKTIIGLFFKQVSNRASKWLKNHDSSGSV